MRLLTAVFVLLAAIAAWQAAWGAFGLSLLAAAGTAWARQVFDRQERDYLSSPSSAREPQTTIELLEQEDCACMAPVLPTDFFVRNGLGSLTGTGRWLD